MGKRRMIRSAGAALALVLLSTVHGPPAGADGPSGYSVGGYAPLPRVDLWKTIRMHVDASGRSVAVFHRPDGDLEAHRYLADGRVDASYGSGGSVVIPFETGWYDGPVLQVLADDGALYIRDPWAGRLIRVTSAGVVDPAFDQTRLAATVVAPDGSLYGTDVVAGARAVVRYLPTGALDTAHGAAGAATVPACGADPAEVAPLDDGGALVSCSPAGADTMVRLDAAGSVMGTRQEPELSAWDQTLSGDGAILLSKSADGTTLLRRFSPTLEPDATFGSGGTAAIPGSVGRAFASGERTFVVTTATPSIGRRTVRVASIAPDGLDPAFGLGGTITIESALPRVRPVAIEFLMGAAPDGAGGAVVTTSVIPAGPAGGVDDFDARVRFIDGSGSVRSEVRSPVVFGPVELSGGPAALALSTIEASLATQTDAIRRFAPEPVAPFGSASAFADRLSLDVRGRPASAAEIGAFERAVADGVPAATLVARALAEPTWAPWLEPAVRLYWAYFGRPPDPTGLRYWMGRRAAGLSVARMSAVFADSSEFKRTYGALTNRQFVELVYGNVMEREGDPGGIAYWTSRLDRRITSRGHLMATFSESNEHERRRTSQVAVVSRFVALIGRTPTMDELALWSGSAPYGDADALTRFLLSSEEYAQRVGAESAGR
jgi:hypothetical protein